MTSLSSKDFMKEYFLKNDTMTASELQKIDKYPICPRDSKLYSEKGFINNDNGIMERSHWTCSCIKDNKSFYFDSFGGQPDKFSLEQLPKPITYHNYKIQDANSRLCGSCLYFFSVTEIMDYCDGILNIYFG